MHDDIALCFAGVRKTYPLYSTPGQRAMDALGFYRLLPPAMRPQFPTFDALRDVSFAVRRGERVGVVGRNGAGKTTLLKLVTGNFVPTSGAVHRGGSVHSLMQTGIGFSSEMTGRQNVRAALAYNNLQGDQFEDAVKDIIEFCELGDHIDQPMKTYSLGMGARLQFAAATAIHPDILIIDEVLGAGDVYFTHKSAARIRRFADDGATLLIVSHSMQQVLEFCDRVIWLDRGRVVMDGPALEVVDAYEVYLERLSHRGISSDDPQSRLEPSASADEMKSALSDGRRVYRWPGKPGVRFAGLSIGNSDDDRVTARPGEPLTIRITLVADVAARYHCRYLVTFWSGSGQRVARLENEMDEFDIDAGETRVVTCKIAALPITSGQYHLSFSLYDLSSSDRSTANSEARFETLVHALQVVVVADEEADGYLIHHPAMATA
jgi:lipopolysaccharide transport system ATP-binding protein